MKRRKWANKKAMKRTRERRDKRERRQVTETHVSLGVEEWSEGGSQRSFGLLSRQLFYPCEWDRGHALKRPVMRHMLDCEGVTAADVRDMRYVTTHDEVVVRLWNGRKFPISGIHMFEAHP